MTWPIEIVILQTWIIVFFVRLQTPGRDSESRSQGQNLSNDAPRASGQKCCWPSHPSFPHSLLSYPCCVLVPFREPVTLLLSILFRRGMDSINEKTTEQYRRFSNSLLREYLSIFSVAVTVLLFSKNEQRVTSEVQNYFSFSLQERCVATSQSFLQSV